ncbi:endonuclease V [Halobium salinum]|uniref:Endonuclease V n=1 Tax=Halobium salinum TaxID=1364940 RepID=A0ABD5P7K1_9EURY|nr:endonuclease V [Halobium salinum]
MRPARPDLAPDPALSRAEMEALQDEVRAAAVFEDDLPFDPAHVSASASLTAATGTASDEQTTLGGGESDAADRPLVAGVDQAFLDERAVSAVVVARGDEVVERAHAVSPLSVPYIPGLLSFREGGPILDAFAELDCEPDLALFDGSGRIHYREAGLATHMGVVLDLPSVGVAKGLLCGRPAESTDGRPAGWRTPIRADGDVTAPEGTVVGYAFQSRQYENSRSINPLYVSPGHRVAADTAVDLVERLGGDYKLPEPTRLADAYADEVKQAVE